MAENIPGKLFEHNNWANLQIIQACVALSDEQLDADPSRPRKGAFAALCCISWLRNRVTCHS